MSSNRSSSGIAVISLDFASTTTCPSDSLFSVAQAETMWMAAWPSRLLEEPRSVLPSMATNRFSVISCTACIQPKRPFSNAPGSRRASTRRNVASGGMPLAKSRKRASHVPRSHPNSWIAAKELAPDSAPQTAMKTMLISGCLRVRSTRGSLRSWKWSWKAAGPSPGMIGSVGVRLRSLGDDTPLYAGAFPQATSDPYLDAAALVSSPHWHQRRRVRVHPRRLDAWYRTLDQLHAAKERTEVALFHRLRDLFSLKPELVLYDITSTYFEGAGRHDFAKHGYSRDGKLQNVQVIVGVVMVAGWPIAHHVWAGNRIDHSTVQEVINDLRKPFEFGRLVFVGDRGMVTDESIEKITKEEHGFLVGIKRRRNTRLDAWLDAIDGTKWIDCPGGINTRERKTDPPRTRAQEVPSGDSDLRGIVIDSDERRGFEQAKRQQAMERARQKLEKLKERVASGDLKQPEKIGAAGLCLKQLERRENSAIPS